MELFDLLTRAEAPDALTSWVRDGERDFGDAWQGVERGDHRVWLGACGGIPLESLVEGAAAAVLAALDAFDEVEPLAVAVELAVAGADASELIEAADECERLAQGGVGSYRGAAPPGYASAARAAALVARAAEGLAAGEASREAGRLERARAISVNLGIGLQAALPAAAGAARLDVLGAAHDPATGAFSFCVAACAEAIREAARATAARGGGETEAAEHAALRALDALVRETIEESAD